MTGSEKISGSVSESEYSLSSGSSSGPSSSAFVSSSGIYCDWEITGVAYVADDTMDFTVTNNSSDGIVVTDISLSVPASYALNLTPPQSVPGNSSLAFRVVTVGYDIRGARVTITTDHCGVQFADFPIGP